MSKPSTLPTSFLRQIKNESRPPPTAKPTRTCDETQRNSSNTNSPKRSDFGAPPSSLTFWTLASGARPILYQIIIVANCEGKRVTLFAFHRPMEEEVQLLDVSELFRRGRGRLLSAGLLSCSFNYCYYYLPNHYFSTNL